MGKGRTPRGATCARGHGIEAGRGDRRQQFDLSIELADTLLLGSQWLADAGQSFTEMRASLMASAPIKSALRSSSRQSYG